MKYKLKYWFEHGGGCLWSKNEEASAKYGYPVVLERLPISEKLIGELYQLEKEYGSYLNWSDPASPSPWTEEHKRDFLSRAQKVHVALVAELGEDFDVISSVERSVGLHNPTDNP